MKLLDPLRFSLLLAAALTPFICALLSGSKYFELATIPAVWIFLTALVFVLKLISDARAMARRKIAGAAAEGASTVSRPSFVQEVGALVYLGDYFTLAIGLLPAVVLYFILLLLEYDDAANGFILLASLVATAFWLRWLEKHGYATIVLPLVPIKLYYVVLLAIALAMVGALRELFFS